MTAPVRKAFTCSLRATSVFSFPHPVRASRRFLQATDSTGAAEAEVFATRDSILLLPQRMEPQSRGRSARPPPQLRPRRRLSRLRGPSGGSARALAPPLPAAVSLRATETTARPPCEKHRSHPPHLLPAAVAGGDTPGPAGGDRSPSAAGLFYSLNGRRLGGRRNARLNSRRLFFFSKRRAAARDWREGGHVRERRGQ